MQNLYEQLIDLLGKPRPLSGDLFSRFVQDLDERPVVDSIHERIWHYDFPKSGIGLHFDAKSGLFWSFSLFIAVPQVESGEVKSYRGNLPYGINRSDTEEVVEQKFRGGTMAVKDYRTDVDLRPLEITFHFSARDFDAPGMGERRMVMVTANYLSPALKDLTGPP